MFSKLFLFLILVLLFTAQAQISPAVAANMKFTFEEIIDSFSKHTGFKVTPVYGSSGKLITQIKNGAPYDLFISADIAFTDSIVSFGLNYNEPRIYAFGKIVLWTIYDFDLSKGITILTENRIKAIAIGDIKQTAYGPATKKILQRFGIWKNIESKLVFAESITKVTQFIVSGSTDIGFSAKSMVLSGQMRNKGKWIEIDSTLYDPLPHTVVILKYGKDNPATEKLYDYILSKTTQNILKRYGYGLP